MPDHSSKNAFSYTSQNIVELVRGGRNYFDILVNMIDSAQFTVHFQVYIFDDDETGNEVALSLMRAATRGVKVFVLVDGFASQGLPETFIDNMKDSGVNFRFFEPLFKNDNFYFGRRLHHKVVVTDGLYCLVGGLNIANRYNDMPGQGAWMDWGVYVGGSVSAELEQICIELWKKTSREPLPKITVQELPNDLQNETCNVRIRRNDWLRKYNQISGSYIEMFRKANDEIIIMSSYFLPGRVIRKKMAASAKRGVHIKLLLTGESDIRIVKYAERYIYKWIFKNNVRLFEYQKNVLHGKLSTYDKKWVTVGSYNVNFISAYASVELNLDIDNEKFAKQVEETINKIIIQDCVEVHNNDFESRYNFFQHLLHKLSYEFIQLVFFLFTFYFRPKKE